MLPDDAAGRNSSIPDRVGRSAPVWQVLYFAWLETVKCVISYEFKTYAYVQTFKMLELEDKFNETDIWLF